MKTPKCLSVMRDASYSSGSRWEGFEGQKGSLMIFGGFPAWSKTESIDRALDDHVFAKLTPDLMAKINKILKIPGPRGHVALIDIHPLDSPKLTRIALMKIVKEIRNTVGEMSLPGGGATKLWASASKPPEHRRQDKKLQRQSRFSRGFSKLQLTRMLVWKPKVVCSGQETRSFPKC